MTQLLTNLIFKILKNLQTFAIATTAHQRSAEVTLPRDRFVAREDREHEAAVERAGGERHAEAAPAERTLEGGHGEQVEQVAEERAAHAAMHREARDRPREEAADERHKERAEHKLAQAAPKVEQRVAQEEHAERVQRNVPDACALLAQCDNIIEAP